MNSAEPSFTALATAFARGWHAQHGVPRIFDDFIAPDLVDENERRFFAGRAEELLPRMRPDLDLSRLDAQARMHEYMRARGLLSIVVARACFAEEQLMGAMDEGVAQYVILGAGLDSFALRRGDLRDRLAVFEIDHPATQASKRARLARAGFASPPNLHFLPIDFERESIADVLRRSPFRADAPAFFSWLGVTYYLSRETIFEVLRTIRRTVVPGSRVCFDYLDLDAFDSAKASPRVRDMIDLVRGVGEPMISGFAPERLPDELGEAGFRVIEALSPREQQKRYFAGRTDGLIATEHFHFALVEA